MADKLSPDAASIRASIEPAARRTLAEAYRLPADGVEWAWQDFDSRFPWASVTLPDLPPGPAIGRNASRAWAQKAAKLMADSVTEITAAMISLEAELWHARHPPGRPTLRIIDGGAGGGASGGGSAA